LAHVLAEGETTGTLMLLCPVCDSDRGEPLGVTGPFAGPVDGIVIIRCSDCTTVYLSPDRAGLGSPPPRLPVSALNRRRVRQWTRGLTPGAKILVGEGADGAQLESIARTVCPGCVVVSSQQAALTPSDKFDLIFLPLTLESAIDPKSLLQQIAARLTPAGRAVAIVNNIGSPAFRLFGGRHWGGYQFPHTRQHLGAAAMRRLADNAGLKTDNLRTLCSAEDWLTSVRNWLRDWGASTGAVSLIAGPWLLPRAVAMTVEGLPALFGKGSLLVAELRRP
jgi:hypothetical protein